MRYLTAIEAARRIGVSEKTIRLWVKDGKIEAHHPAPNRLAIAEADVERIAQERRQYYGSQPETASHSLTQPEVSARDIDTLTSQLSHMSRQIQDLEYRVSQLEANATTHTSIDHAWLVHPEQSKPIVEPSPVEKPRNRNVSPRRGTPLPDGYILASEFAKQHGIPRETMRDYITKGIGVDKEKIEVSERPKPGREHETERHLTHEQQEAAIEILKRHGKIKD